MTHIIEYIIGISWCVVCAGFAIWSFAQYIIEKNKKL